MSNRIEHDHNPDGIDRRGFLKCMAWAGTGLLWTLTGGVPRSYGFGQRPAPAAAPAPGDFSFVQISDSHIGFSKEANKDVTATLREAVARINALPTPPAFLIHTGDLSHLSKAEEFDTLDEILKGVRTNQVFTVPGEHDVLNDDGQQYRARYGKGARGAGWYSFDQKGVHFIGLVNVTDLKAGGLGSLGREQLEWLENDVQGLRDSTPIVVFAHIPLWTVSPEWGWGTDDSAQALSYLKRFGSVTVLNGHIHQTLQKVEGHVTFHTAMSTAFPQPRPGTAPSPGPMTVPAGQLRGLLGVTNVSYVPGQSTLAIVDAPLAAASAAATDQVKIDSFSFLPATLSVPAGTQVTWTNRDDVPHTVVDTEKRFASSMLDTGDQFSYRFTTPGAYAYFCSMHPKMTGKIVVHEG
jgi:plastocyanin